MARVNCDVESCSYNKSHTCYAGQILISEQGMRDNNTCCDAYLNEETYSNLAAYTTSDTPVGYVKCRVGNCRHYENNTCNLEHIHISSQTPTNLYIDTRCNKIGRAHV